MFLGEASPPPKPSQHWLARHYEFSYTNGTRVSISYDSCENAIPFYLFLLARARQFLPPVRDCLRSQEYYPHSTPSRYLLAFVFFLSHTLYGLAHVSFCQTIFVKILRTRALAVSHGRWHLFFQFCSTRTVEDRSTGVYIAKQEELHTTSRPPLNRSTFPLYY